MAKIVTMGEIMLRLSPNSFKRFVQAEQFGVTYGGAEANVAVSLANYGHDSYFISKLPNHEIGQSAVNHLRRFGVKTDYIARGGDRIGIYYLENGASMRPSHVIYDRSNSSICEATLNDFDFDAIFKEATWFHWSGITPALGEQVIYILEQALKAAKRHNVTVSVDINYRKKLWSLEQSQKTMLRLMKYVDVCIGLFVDHEEEVEQQLGFNPVKKIISDGKLELNEFKSVFKKMKEQFNFKYMVTTIRESHSASDNGMYAVISDGNELVRSRYYDMRIVDRVGGGDAFAGGLIHGLLTKETMGEALEFACAASALKHTIPGDANIVSEMEVNRLVQGEQSGRVQR